MTNRFKVLSKARNEPISKQINSIVLLGNTIFGSKRSVKLNEVATLVIGI